VPTAPLLTFRCRSPLTILSRCSPHGGASVARGQLRKHLPAVGVQEPLLVASDLLHGDAVVSGVGMCASQPRRAEGCDVDPRLGYEGTWMEPTRKMDLPREREVDRRLGRVVLLSLAVSVVVVVVLVVWLR
jgi:hypothetical protein